MKVLIACEYSGRVRDAFIAKGHDAISCDILPTDSHGPHYQGNVLDILDSGYDLLIAHPPCTYLTNSGVRHFSNSNAKINGAARFLEMDAACDFFNQLWTCDIPKICIENPIPHKYAKAQIGNYTQIIQPWQFGHKETKATCLWLKNLPKLKPTRIVGPPPKNMDMDERKLWHKVHYAPPSKDRWKIRSTTYNGIAKALASQFGE